MTDTVFTFDVSYQARLLVYALVIGALIGALYDLFRVFRVFLQPAAKNGESAGDALMTAVCFVGDVAFFILSAVIVTIFLFHANHGNSRGFILAGAVLGFTLYLASIGRITIRAAKMLRRIAARIGSFLAQKLLFPMIRALLKSAASLWYATGGRITARLQRLHRRRVTQNAMRELELFCARIQPQEILNESGQTLHPREARNLRSIPLSDRHARQRADPVQQPRGGTGKAPPENRRCTGRYRRNQQ